MPSQSPHLDTTPFVWIVQNQHWCRPSGNSQLRPAKRRVSAPARKMDSSQGGFSVASTIHGQVLEHHYAAKQHFVHSIWHMHKGDLERGILEQQPTLDITLSNRNQVPAQVDKLKSHCIQSARDNIAELYDLHRFESDAEYLEFVESLLADNKYRFPVAECVEGGLYSPNPTQRVSKAANEWPASTFLPGSSRPGVYLHQILPLGK